jgi:hypothetical protein
MTVAGLAVGLFAAYALARSIQTLLFGITPQDPMTYGRRSGAAHRRRHDGLRRAGTASRAPGPLKMLLRS